MIVVDASAWATALIDAGPAGEACRAALGADSSWLAPGHAPLEVLRTLRRCELSGALDREATERLADQVLETEIRLVGDSATLAHAWRLRHNLSLYDGPYVSLALRFAVELITLDRRLERAAVQAGATVTVPR